MSLLGIDHVNIDTSRPEETIDFYTEVLGLENRPEARPDIGSPGAWMYLGDQPVVHLNFHEETLALPDLEEFDIERPLDDRDLTTGAFNHVAFAGKDFEGMCNRLDAKGLQYKTVDMPTFKQIFVRDPNGVAVEINIRT